MHESQWRLVLPADTDTPARARRKIEALVPAAVRNGDVAILVSEVVTNAVRHGGGGDGPPERIIVDVALRRHDLLVHVRDGGAGLPRQREPGADGGFGLHLVEALADAWGARPGEVWFRLDLRREAA